MTDPLRPPETDEEPWYLRRTQYPPTQVSRELSGTIMAACILGAVAIVILAAAAWGNR